MKISSQLANNFDYCSAEFEIFPSEKLFTLRAQRLRGVFFFVYFAPFVVK
jgi:hypothetical protein